MSAFPDLDDDDGPGFEYDEEPELEANDADADAYFEGAAGDPEPPDQANQDRERRARDGVPLVPPSTGGEIITVVETSPPPPPPATPVALPRPRIVSARRVQHERLREEGLEAGERRRQPRPREGGGGVGVPDIEGDFGGGSAGGERGGDGVGPPRRKRGRCSGIQDGSSRGGPACEEKNIPDKRGAEWAR